MPREILVDWNTDAGTGLVSVFMFLTPTAVADQRAALNTFLGTIDAGLANTIGWVIRTSGREMDDASGNLTGVWGHSTAYTGAGGGTGEPVPDASQALFRWATDHIVNGRFLKGRTFIPGVVAAAVVNGNMAAGTQNDFTAAGQALIDDAVQLAVWHRPVAGAGGVAWTADTCSVWSELAVLRRRRH